MKYNASPAEASSDMVVAQAAPATPHLKPKINKRIKQQVKAYAHAKYCGCQARTPLCKEEGDQARGYYAQRIAGCGDAQKDYSQRRGGVIAAEQGDQLQCILADQSGKGIQLFFGV